MAGFLILFLTLITMHLVLLLFFCVGAQYRFHFVLLLTSYKVSSYWTVLLTGTKSEQQGGLNLSIRVPTIIIENHCYSDILYPSLLSPQRNGCPGVDIIRFKNEGNNS